MLHIEISLISERHQIFLYGLQYNATHKYLSVWCFAWCTKAPRNLPCDLSNVVGKGQSLVELRFV